jgi:hypothetical protein
MKKATLFVFAVLFGFAALFAAPAFADHHDKGGQCELGSKCKGDDCGKCNSGKNSDCDKCPIMSKIMKKAKFFLSNSKEIGLSDEQVAAIKAIKMDTKKAGIRTEAEMKIWEMDLDAKLSEPAVDVEGLNAMIDKASAGWGEGAKQGIATYAKLKAILSEAQMAKAKEIWMAKKD